MSRKVGVITLHNSPNYGSCLQTYATQVVLARVGADAEIIDYYRKDAIPENEVARALNGQLVKKMPIFKVPGIKQIAKIPVSRMVARRRAPLDEFRHSKLALTDRSYYSADELDANPPVADIYCTGSDQVWNSIWNNGFDRAFYLSFAPEGKKKIAYAASIGKAALEDWEAEPMRKALSSYSCISVREQEAADLLDSIGVHGAVPVIDPTLMLNRDDWEAIADGWISPEPYILVYQLNRNSEFDSYVQKVAKKTGLKVMRIAYGVHEKRSGENAVICPSVGRFLSLFLGAEIVITDSFHGTAYSVNLGKKFVAISPGRFNGRIANLLAMTGLEDHWLQSFKNLELAEASFNYDSVKNALDSKRREAIVFLDNAVNH